MRRDKRRVSAVVLAAVAVAATVVGCTVPVGGPSAATSVPGASSVVTSARPSATGPVVTVPGLGGVTPSSTPSAAPSSSSPSESPPSASSASGPTSSAGATPSSDVAVPAPSSVGVPPQASPEPIAPPAATGRTAQVDLSGTCPDCSVISSRAEVVGDLSVAVVSMAGGRTAAMAIRPDGSSASILAVPYGITFPTPPGGVLPCDSGGRCLIAATTGDGGVVTALGLGDDGRLTDLSPPDGFMSVGVPAQILDLDGEPGVAVLEVPGSEPIWTVYSWNGDTYGPVGCTVGATPDLTTLDLSRCG